MPNLKSRQQWTLSISLEIWISIEFKVRFNWIFLQNGWFLLNFDVIKLIDQYEIILFLGLSAMICSVI